MSASLKPKSFAQQLRAAIDERGISIREAASRWKPDNPESARSHLHKFLRSAHIPSRTTRRSLAVALGFPAGHFIDDEDDEESDQVPSLSLDELLRLRIRAMLDEERGRVTV